MERNHVDRPGLEWFPTHSKRRVRLAHSRIQPRSIPGLYPIPGPGSSPRAGWCGKNPQTTTTRRHRQQHKAARRRGCARATAGAAAWIQLSLALTPFNAAPSPLASHLFCAAPSPPAKSNSDSDLVASHSPPAAVFSPALHLQDTSAITIYKLLNLEALAQLGGRL